MIQFNIGGHIEQSRCIRLLEEAKNRGITWFEIEGDIDRETCDEVERFCRDNGFILTVTDNHEMLCDKKFHGILYANGHEHIATLREEAGGHPIVGVLIDPRQNPAFLRPLDIDYLAVDMDRFSLDETTELFDNYLKSWDIPVVARKKCIDEGTMQKYLEYGFKGFNVSQLPL